MPFITRIIPPRVSDLSYTQGQTNDCAYPLGYNGPGDGGGGPPRIWVEGSTATPDGVLIIKPTGATGAWVAQFDGDVSVKWFGAKGDGVTNDTASIVFALASVALTGGTLFFPVGTYVLSSLNIPSGVGLRGAGSAYSVLSFPTLGANINGLTVQVDDVAISGLSLVGPASGAYVANETLVHLIGASASARLQGASIQGCEFSNVGSYGIRADFVDKLEITHCVIHDIGYAGVLLISCNDAFIADNSVATITPGTAGNNYGLSVSHDSTGWPGTRIAQPFCERVTILNNHVDDVAWTGIDSHGGIALCVQENRVTNCGISIAVASGSGAAANYAGYDNKILDNWCDGGSKANTAAGIIVNGGSVELQRHTIVRGNTVINHGAASNVNSGAITCALSHDVIITNNQIRQWGGSGVYCDSPDDVNINNNFFGKLANPSDSIAVCVLTPASSGKLSVRGNLMSAEDGTAGRIGISATLLATAPIITDNDFSAATANQYTLKTTGIATGGANLPTIVSPTNGTTVPDISACGPFVTINFAYSAPATVTNITSAFEGQRVLLVNTTINAITITRANAVLPGASTVTLNHYGTLELIKIGSLWYAVSHEPTNG